MYLCLLLLLHIRLIAPPLRMRRHVGKYEIALLAYAAYQDAVALQNTPSVKSIRAITKFQRPKYIYISNNISFASDHKHRMLDLRVMIDINDNAILPDPEANHIITVCIFFCLPCQ